jgi:hypothetical protein
MSPRAFHRNFRERRGLGKVVPAPHPFDSSLGVDHPLLPGIEGVALTAYFYPQRGLGGAGLEGVSTGASHCGVKKLGMDFWFHDVVLMNLC